MQTQILQTSAIKTLPFILFALAMLALAGCAPTIAGATLINGTTVGLGGAAAGTYYTRPGDLPPADTADQIAAHDDWCYSTAGYAECYPYPVKDAASRLINVDPQSRYPLTPREYYEATVETQ